METKTRAYTDARNSYIEYPDQAALEAAQQNPATMHPVLRTATVEYDMITGENGHESTVDISVTENSPAGA